MNDEAKERRVRAQAAIQRRDFAAARAELEALVAAEPANPDGHGLLGAMRAATGDLAGAATSYATALRLRPGHSPTAHLLGTTLLKINAVGQALSVLAPAAATAPEDAAIQAAYAAALMRAERFAEAAEAATRAVDRNPDLVSAWVALGAARRLQGDNDGALEATGEALRLSPDLAEAHANRASALLSLGRFDEGWAESEWYWRQDHAPPPRPLTQPWWNGEPVAGTIAVRGDPGIGDQLWASAFLPELRQAGHRLVLECAPRLARLFARSFPDIEVVPALDPPHPRLSQPDVLAQTPLSRLPALAWRSERAARRPTHRLIADPVRTKRLRGQYLELAKGRRIVGIAWRGRRSDGQRFEVPLVLWEPVLRRPDLFVVDLQHGDTRSDREETRQRVGEVPYRDPTVDALGDMDDFAAQVAATDGVVTVANAVMDMALAVGTPAIIAVRAFQGDWRYPPAPATDSPWLPGARLVRQQNPGQWNDVLGEIAKLAAR